MSTQPSSFPAIPFSITTPSQNLRLLELPPDLLELITSDNRPEKLYLKSSSTTPSTTGAPSNERTPKPKPDEYLHLVSDDKIWAIRQVSTSNAVYITRTQKVDHPTRTEQSDDDGDTQMIINRESQSTMGITAFAQVNNTLELTERQISPQDVETQTRKMVSIYPYANEDQGEMDLSLKSPSKSALTVEGLHHNIQAPNTLINRAIKGLFIFPFPSPSGIENIYIPPDALLLDSWKSLIRCSTLTGLTLSLSSASSNEALLASISNDESDGTLLSAVARAMLVHFTDLEEVESRTRQFLGRLVVRCREEIKIAELLDQWRDLVPDSWSSDVLREDDILGEDGHGGSYVLHEEDRVVSYVPGLEGMGSIATNVRDDGKLGTLATGAGAAGNKRKWHEKFGKQRDQR